MGSIYRRTEEHCKTCRRRLKKTSDREACTEAGHEIERRTSPVYWIKYTRAGKTYAESSGSKLKGKAGSLLKLREGDIQRGFAVTNKVGRTTFDEAAADLINEYTMNDRRSLDEAERRIRKHLKPFFGGWLLANITTVEVRRYQAQRKADGIVNRRTGERRKDVSNAEINRELALLKRMFTLTIKAGLLHQKPDIPKLDESAPRAGFFEPHQLANVLGRLPPEIRSVVKFAAITGWRMQSEVLALEWRNVDFDGGEVKLLPGTTKNGEGRTFPFTTELRQILDERHAEHLKWKKAGRLVPQVFFREVAEERGGTKLPRPITTFAKAWKKACREAGYPGRLPHDLRRTAIRAFVRQGIHDKVAMKLSGHKSRSVFDNYNTITSDDLRDAARKLDGNSSYGFATVDQKRTASATTAEKIS